MTRRSSDNSRGEAEHDDNGDAHPRMPAHISSQSIREIPTSPNAPFGTLTSIRKPRWLPRAAFSFSLKSSLSSESTRGPSYGDLSDPETGLDPNNTATSTGSNVANVGKRSIFRGGLSTSALRTENPLSTLTRRGSNESYNNASVSSNNSHDSSERLNSGNSRKSSRTTFRLPLFSPPVNSSSANEYYDDYGYSSTGGMTSTIKNGTTMRSRLTSAYRRYQVNDYVLITNHEITDLSPQSEHRTINLVNRYGYPEWGGGASTSEERRGPYIYLLAKVVSVHFGEDAQYYTVRREDNMEDQRADAQYMEPITDTGGIEAAKLAARKRETNETITGSERRVDGIRCLRPCTSAFTNCTSYIKEMMRNMYTKIKIGSEACMTGNKPYGISCRFTGVNFFVLCSVWYLYIDQLRLAFMPHSADYGCAVVSAIVWLVLVLELFMEVFIRPNGYYKVIRSEKAYLPSTVRYINNFHLFSELISLIFFVPEFMCLFSSESCGARYPFSLANACLMSLYGPDRLHAFYGTAFICIMRLRIFGMVRHWTKMWINNTFVRVRGKNGEWRVQRGKGLFVPQGHNRRQGHENVVSIEESITSSTKNYKKDDGDVERKNEFTDDYHLTNASKIGTALFTTNAKRGLIFVFLIGLAPLVPVVVKVYGGTNQHLQTSTELLQSNNLALSTVNNQTCDQFQYTIIDWVKSNAIEIGLEGSKNLHLLSLVIEPVRCEFQTMSDGSTDAGTLATIACRNATTIERCKTMLGVQDCAQFCLGWALTSEEDRLYYLENFYGIRPSTTVSVNKEQPGTYTTESGEVVSDNFSVRVLYNESLSVKRTIISLFALQLGMTIFVLLGLSVLRHDAGRLVLGPLRRMLKIVAFYAKNPLSPPPQREGGELSVRNSFRKQNDAYYYDSDDEDSDKKQLGTFETEQLINAVTKITDLLRKCWGVAGAGIISSNLARQEGGLNTTFNPTVPGKAVYALFAFAVIDKFQSHLHALKGDIMILINDIAAVLHEEVYRWGYEDSGQCNKNLGAAFLMVYKIGAVHEVVEKRERAEAVIFSGKNTAKARRRKTRNTISAFGQTRTSSVGGSHRASNADADRFSRSHVDNLDLSSLPGMRTFSDRALLGLLKTFVGIHRDKTILNWNNDFRLTAGVGAVSINLNFGMDAGWAVEGAVGSSYKIDATYLSPHVNMASRMMSATKQYGVYFLLSQAVQKLLSENAQDKLRHIDTVTVKGSSVQQKIFTYDAKVRSDFFLYSKTESQADLDSDRYSPAIWNTDQDLVAMRSHICDEFMEVFNRGRDEYLAGNWPAAIKLLKKADKIMFEREVEEGYSAKSYADSNLKSLTNLLDDKSDEAEERLSMGDGPCQRLIAYMEEMGGRGSKELEGI